jgi:hypothetical protein
VRKHTAKMQCTATAFFPVVIRLHTIDQEIFFSKKKRAHPDLRDIVHEIISKLLAEVYLAMTYNTNCSSINVFPRE